mmetsp:Transcript_30803/g.65206  ORF Transcript_30803/g.65206 Transcript_30803/m.65206 type:complete len:569 (+) Transcript_30803:22-1728(+)
MPEHKFCRWENALKKCMDAKRKGPSEASKDRWNGDPLLLNQEAHELAAEKQLEALDMVAEAPASLRELLAPVWKYCFAQWHIYDAGLEALESGTPLREAFSDDVLVKDITLLRSLFDKGELVQAKAAEQWQWGLLDSFGAAGSIEPWDGQTSAPLLDEARRCRRQGIMDFQKGLFSSSFAAFHKGLRSISRAPPTLTGPHAKLRCDLYKNKSFAASKLKLGRTALQAANFALAIDAMDPKGWYRRATALELLGKVPEAQQARVKAGLPGQESDVLGTSKADKVAPGVLKRADPAVEETRETAEPELALRHHALLESMVFVEVGFDSISSLDMINHLRTELEVPVSATLVFDHTIVAGVVASLLRQLNTGAEEDLFMRSKMNNTVWRAMCHALGMDPVQGVLDGRLGHATSVDLSDEDASDILQKLTAVYEEPSFAAQVRELARSAHFDQRSFLLRLRPLSLPLQAPILEEHSFTPDAEGLRNLEAALLETVERSAAPEALRRKLTQCRIAQQGGPDGLMWTVNMEANEVQCWADSQGLESWSRYVQADPFGPNRKNTNAVMPNVLSGG